MKQIEQVLIPCTVSEGLFANEASVRIVTESGATVSVLVDRSLLENRNGHDYLRATQLEISDGVSVCLLPVESNETASRWVRVPTAQLLTPA
jgi:hypothetical protein